MLDSEFGMQLTQQDQIEVTPAVQENASTSTVAQTAVKALTAPQALDAWDQAMLRAHQLLGSKLVDTAWIARFTALTTSVRALVARDPDSALYVLIEANGRNVDHYSSQHAMTCLVIAELSAAWMQWSEEERWSLALAALSMNLSITSLQDTLAKQSAALSDGQREKIAAHAAASADMLIEAGVTNTLWLHVVRNHHVVADAETTQESDQGQRLAELLRRVDIYSAKLSRRGTRRSVTPAIAAQEACLDTNGRPDFMGTALLKVVGLYPPGTFVALANGETAVVIARGAKAHTPIVASIRRTDGGLMMQPMRRDTLRKPFAVKHGLEPSHVRVLLNHRRTLSCT